MFGENVCRCSFFLLSVQCDFQALTNGGWSMEDDWFDFWYTLIRSLDVVLCLIVHLLNYALFSSIYIRYETLLSVFIKKTHLLGRLLSKQSPECNAYVGRNEYVENRKDAREVKQGIKIRWSTRNTRKAYIPRR
jgi:hypothetical protein